MKRLKNSVADKAIGVFKGRANTKFLGTLKMLKARGQA